jgi:hypothetical protein
LTYQFRAHTIINSCAQALGEDWDTPARIAEVKEALTNHADIMYLLWPQCPSPNILRRVLNFVNYGSMTGEDEKGRVR